MSKQCDVNAFQASAPDGQGKSLWRTASGGWKGLAAGEIELLRARQPAGDDLLPVAIIELVNRQIDWTDWDRFAMACGASFWCGADALDLGVPAYHFPRRLRRFEFYSLPDRRKIGQCAIGVTWLYTKIVDGLQILPEAAHLWEAAMAALLSSLGAGRYYYGSRWSIEPSRDNALSIMAGVSIEAVEPVIVQGIDFSRWPSWDAYLHDVSSNARRNAKRALKNFPALGVGTRHGVSTLRDITSLIRLYRSVSRRKRLDTSILRIVASLFARMTVLRRHATSATVGVEGQILSAYFEVQFGRNVYYLNGGSEADNGGAAWHLLLIMIRRAFEHSSGKGKFLMGVINDDASPAWANLARSRAQCRVSEFPTSLVTFRYDPQTINA